jgi:hypothetical protein
MSTRLNRENVERQLAEMWDAVATCGDQTGKAAEDARRVERDLRAGLAAQDRLDEAAPAMLEALRILQEEFLLCAGAGTDPTLQALAEKGLGICSRAIARAVPSETVVVTEVRP